MGNIEWNAAEYKQGFDFVPFYGEDLIGLIEAEPGQTVIDLGCGGGSLTCKLKERGFSVRGIDASEAMLRQARADHPDLEFELGDALTFRLERPADVIFSNAVLHWIDGDKQDLLLANLARNLRPGGQLVCELGGRGCAEAVHSELERLFRARGLRYPRSFYFPTIGQYAPRLEQAGFKVEFAALFDRPTPQSGGRGLADWNRMFNQAAFRGLSPELSAEILEEAERGLRERLFKDGRWIVDYVRLRLKCRRL